MNTLEKVLNFENGMFSFADNAYFSFHDIYFSQKYNNGQILITKTKSFYNTGVPKKFLPGSLGSVFDKTINTTNAYVWEYAGNIYIQTLNSLPNDLELLTLKLTVRDNLIIDKQDHKFLISKKQKFSCLSKTPFLYISYEKKNDHCMHIINTSQLNDSLFDYAFVKNPNNAKFQLIHNNHAFTIINVITGEIQFECSKMKTIYKKILLIDDKFLVCIKHDDNNEMFQIISENKCSTDCCPLCNKPPQPKWTLSCGHQMYCTASCLNNTEFKCRICNVKPKGAIPPTEPVRKPTTLAEIKKESIRESRMSVCDLLNTQDVIYKNPEPHFYRKMTTSDYGFMPTTPTEGLSDSNEPMSYSTLTLPGTSINNIE